MSVTPTPSEYSVQTRYYDEPEAHFLHIMDDSEPVTKGGNSTSHPRAGSSELEARTGSPSRVVPLHSAGHENPGNAAVQPSQMEEGGSPLKHADEEGENKTPSLHSLPTEPDGQEKYVSDLRASLGRTGSALGRKESTRTKSTYATASTAAFVNGAPLSGPDAEPEVDDDVLARGAKAEQSLSHKQKQRIVKKESEFCV